MKIKRKFYITFLIVLVCFGILAIKENTYAKENDKIVSKEISTICQKIIEINKQLILNLQKNIEKQIEEETEEIITEKNKKELDSEPTVSIEELDIPITSTPIDNLLVIEPNTKKENAILIQNYYNTLSPEMKKTFVDNGWKIVLSETKLSQRFGYNTSIAGLTDTYTKEVFFDDREIAIKRSFHHELGHVVDCINGWVSETDEFVSIYTKEKNNFKYVYAVGDRHEVSDNIEYFASVFSNIYADANKCKEMVPESYNYVIQFVY